MSLVYSLQASCWAQASTWYEEIQAQLLVNQLLSERNLSWVPPAAPSFLPPSSHLSDLHVSEISAQPPILLKLVNLFKILWQRLYFLKTLKWKKPKPTCSFFFSLRKITHEEECAHLASLYTGQWEAIEVRTWQRIGGAWYSKERKTHWKSREKTSGSALYFLLARPKVSLMPRGLSEMQNVTGTAFLLPPWIPGGDCGCAAAAPPLRSGRGVGWHPKHYSCPSVCR